jgi:high-affinity Fe2+/Pb2+ permease
MSAGTALRLAAWGICVAIALQVIFYFVFQTIGYNSFLLSLTLLISFVVALLIFVGWRTLKRAIR